MRKLRFILAITVLTVSAAHLPAQDNPKPDAKAPTATLKLQVTIVEREGDKKVTSLPYTFFLEAGEGGPASPWMKLRTGSRVPVYAGKDFSVQYIDVGTSIDARGIATEDGRFGILLNLERSWVEGEVAIPTAKSENANPANFFKEPVIRQFKTELSLPMRDGQTTETTQAADPGSGRILSLTVTMNVVK
jgi:hypothetical protein